MSSQLELSLAIFDNEPALRPRRQLHTLQLWKGGATDLSTRTIIERPARWLVLADRQAGASSVTAIENGTPILAWELEQILPGHEVSPAGAGGVILVSMDVDPAHEDEFNDWYNTEHIPRFLKLAGVIAARRFRALHGKPRYVALYHVENTGVYATPAWMAVNSTPWILRLRNFQRNRTYFMFQAAVVD
jgi:hypothetical protein